MSGPKVKEWFINSDFHNTIYSAIFLNDVLSYSFIKKYGGTALNFDILLLKPITSLQQFMTKSSESSIEGQPYNFIHNHPIFEDIMGDLFAKFNGNISQSIGSNLLTNIVKKRCEVSV